MKDFNKFIFEDGDEFKKKAVRNISHFENTRKRRPDGQGFYKRKGFGNWKFKTTQSKGTLVKIKDNGNGTFTAHSKGLFKKEITELWGDMEKFD